MWVKILKSSSELLIGAALIAGSLWYFQYQKARIRQTKKQTMSVPVISAEKVQKKMYADRIEGVGTGLANESVDITANVTEKVAEICFTDGELVKSGKLLVRLADAEEQAERRQALVSIQEQEREMNRIEKMFRAKASTQKAYDEQVARRDRSKFALTVIEAKIADRNIYAPFSGVLGAREVSPGTLVTPGTRITTIDDLSRIKVDFNAPEKYFSIAQNGMDATLASVAYPGRVFKGKVTFRSPRIDTHTRMFQIRVSAENPSYELRPGMLFHVTISLGDRPRIMIPERSLMSLGEVQYVFLVKPDRTVRRVSVTLGSRAHGEVEVLSGLKGGEMLVTEGTSKLVDGLKVQITSPRSGKSK